MLKAWITARRNREIGVSGHLSIFNVAIIYAQEGLVIVHERRAGRSLVVHFTGSLLLLRVP
jgi:hypothetical protein